MKTLIFLTIALFSTFVVAQAPRPRLMCKFEGGYFKVSDGVKRWEKYVGSTTNPVVDCGSDYAVGVGGPYFVTFWNGVIKEEYIGGSGARAFLLRGHMAVAVMSSYLIVAKAGEPIIEKYISGSGTPVIEASNSLAIMAYGSYLFASDGKTVIEKYVGSVTNPVLSAGKDLGGALMGSYLLIFANGKIRDEYIGSRSSKDMIEAGRKSALVAAAVGSSFYVFDAQRNVIRNSYTGAGRVEVREDGAYHSTTNNRMTRYNLATGAFENR